MSYSSMQGKRPPEYASKSSHMFIVKDPLIKGFLDNCNLPKKNSDIDLDKYPVYKFKPSDVKSIKNIIASDGGFTQVLVDGEFPSSNVAFFQYGALQFSLKDLEEISNKAFIDPEDMSKLKSIQRLKLTIPIKNLTWKDEEDLISSVRGVLHSFFQENPDSNSFNQTLDWFIFEKYRLDHVKTWNLSSCPHRECSGKNIALKSKDILEDFTFKCPVCGNKIYLIDIFRFHEIMDNNTGAGGILSYLDSVLIQILIIHLIKLILEYRASLLREIFFIKDGPLSFFGQTAKLHTPMRSLINYLFDNYQLFLVGVEKSGIFVEHAQQIQKKLKNGSYLLLNNQYIYDYVLPRKTNLDSPYGDSTYYGNKIIFKDNEGKVYVITVASRKSSTNPSLEDIPNINEILTLISKLKCDMYDSALIPVALANKLVSLSLHPSSAILEKFARDSISK